MSDFSPHVDTSDTPGWCRTVTAALHRQWERYGQTGLQLAIGLMTIAALWRLGHELPRLVWEQGGPGAVDLRARHAEVQHWFAGQPVYGAVEDRDYPPASYTMLWPSLGWLDVAPARGLGAASTLVALGWLSYLCVRESRAQTRTEYGFIGLLAFAVTFSSLGLLQQRRTSAAA